MQKNRPVLWLVSEAGRHHLSCQLIAHPWTVVVAMIVGDSESELGTLARRRPPAAGAAAADADGPGAEDAADRTACDRHRGTTEATATPACRRSGVVVFLQQLQRQRGRR